MLQKEIGNVIVVVGEILQKKMKACSYALIIEIIYLSTYDLYID